MNKLLKFEPDPLNYIFEGKNLKKIANLWNIKYSKNVLSTLKIAFKYKNGTQLNNKEWKQLISKLKIKLKTKNINTPEVVELVRNKLINIPRI